MSFVSLQREPSSRPSKWSLWPRGLSDRGRDKQKAYPSSPDLIVHGVLDHRRSMEDIREDLKSILERLVCEI